MKKPSDFTFNSKSGSWRIIVWVKSRYPCQHVWQEKIEQSLTLLQSVQPATVLNSQTRDFVEDLARASKAAHYTQISFTGRIRLSHLQTISPTLYFAWHLGLLSIIADYLVRKSHQQFGFAKDVRKRFSIFFPFQTYRYRECQFTSHVTHL